MTTPKDNTLFGLSDLAMQPIPRPIIQDVIPVGLTFISGHSGTGKSQILSLLANSIMFGHKFAGHDVRKTGSVAYLCGEGAAMLPVRQVASMDGSYEPDNPPPFYAIFDRLSLGTDEKGRLNESVDDGWMCLAERLNAIHNIEPLAAIMIDTWASFMTGVDENSNSEVSLVTRRLQEMASHFKCGVIATAHNTKDDKWMRGAGAFLNNSDMVWSIRRDDEKTEQLNSELADGDKICSVYFANSRADYGKAKDSGNSSHRFDMVFHATVKRPDGKPFVACDEYGNDSTDPIDVLSTVSLREADLNLEFHEAALIALLEAGGAEHPVRRSSFVTQTGNFAAAVISKMDKAGWLEPKQESDKKGEYRMSGKGKSRAAELQQRSKPDGLFPLLIKATKQEA